MKTLLPLLALTTLSASLAACGQQEAPAPAPTQTATTPVRESLSPPKRDDFADAFGKACPEAKPVNKAVCKSAGMGSIDFICDYGLGDDEYLRNEATLTQQDDAWVIADPEKVCAQ
ncbi:hypothetical protein MKP08_08130 [Erythrobacter sp. LQ02-29]|uniref:hypothetical protein n=1 Tax=Erythrobacter sp. LQ02-29 TaxID=2920384 RepID=UPI001F4EC9A1|nr:hypothetical protein [Erythrobacter sp. LQ02-29]